MPRKTNGNSGTGRGKKVTNPTTQPAAMQVVSETKKNVVPINLEDEIRRRAFEIYQERGSVPGNEHEDWLRAEREVRSRYQKEQTA